MSKSIYVGNLPWSATEEQVQDLFAEYGSVLSVKLVSDRDTGRARGFGFVEMEDGEVDSAIEALDNFSFGGRTLRVNEAKDVYKRQIMMSELRLRWICSTFSGVKRWRDPSRWERNSTPSSRILRRELRLKT